MVRVKPKRPWAAPEWAGDERLPPPNAPALERAHAHPPPLPRPRRPGRGDPADHGRDQDDDRAQIHTAPQVPRRGRRHPSTAQQKLKRVVYADPGPRARPGLPRIAGAVEAPAAAFTLRRARFGGEVVIEREQLVVSASNWPDNRCDTLIAEGGHQTHTHGDAWTGPTPTDRGAPRKMQVRTEQRRDDGAATGLGSSPRARGVRCCVRSTGRGSIQAPAQSQWSSPVASSPAGAAGTARGPPGST